MPVEDDITLGQLLDRSISAYDRIIEQPSPNEDSVQLEILSALSDLSLCASLISSLSILSPNESLEDINTKDLKCLAVHGLRGFLVLLLKTKGGGERKKNLEQAKVHFEQFTRQIESYEIVPVDQIDRFKGPLSTIQNPALRRESKIAQFKLERQLKAQLEAFQERQKSSQRSAIYASSSRPTEERSRARSSQTGLDDEDEQVDDEHRTVRLTWLKFLYLKAHQELGSIELELDILGQGAQMNDLPRAPKDDEADLSWRLDKLATTHDGPLVSPAGKVLRPFTILPSRVAASSAATNRIRLRAEVFRPDWNLPTMTIDEYLDEQKAMGNFLSGGGPGQATQETQGQRDQREAEEDSMAGELKHEQLRSKAIEWDKFTDTHRKGEGNMMNRG